MDSVRFSVGAARKIQQATQGYLAGLGSKVTGRPRDYSSSSWGLVQISSIIGSQPGRYNGKTISRGTNASASGGLVLTDIGIVASSENCIVWNLREMGHGDSSHGHAINLSDNAQCVLSALPGGSDSASGKPILLVGCDPGAIFRVDLSQTSGSLGNKTTPSTWVYTAKIPGTSTALGTSLTPEVARTNGTFAAATKGIGFYNASGAFVLFYAAEVIGTSGCT
jgi:hypothetical protein